MKYRRFGKTELELPVIVRPSFTLGGSGSGMARTREQFISIVEFGLQKSPVDTDTSIIVIEQNNITMGILADRIGDIEEVASETVEPPLATIDKDRVDCLEGGVELDGRLLGILRLEHIVQGSAAPRV